MKLSGRIGWSLILLGVILTCYPTKASAAQSVAVKLPLVFEPNRGQVAADVRYLLRAGVVEGEFLNDGFRLTLLAGEKTPSQVRMRLIASRVDVSIEGSGALEGQINYLVGNDPARWLRGLPGYAKVRYSQIYAGTDLVFYGNGGALEHDFELQPGADPKRIAFQLDGAQSVTLDENGDLRIGMAGGQIIFERPIAYQTVAGARHNVDAAYSVDKNGMVHFRLGGYDATKKLVIDPVLDFATYLSSVPSGASLIATDAGGNNYIAGSTNLGFPVTSGAFAGCANCTAGSGVTFISKLSADGTNLIYSTMLGGNSFAQPTGIAVDGNGNVLVSGWTGASDFPTKNPQPIAPPDNAYLGFLVSLSADGSSLNYGTMLGSPPSVSPAATTYASAVAVDSSGNAYVTGETGDGFFTTPGALNQAAVGMSRNSFDVYLAKFSPTGTLIYSAVLGTADPQNGGGGPIGASALTVDSAGNAYVAGQAGILWPISSNAYLKEIAGSMPYATPFVTKVAPDAKSLVYSTYLDYAYEVTGIAVLSNESVFVTGNGVGASYPITPNAYQKSGGNAFLTELNSTGSGLTYSTVIGDSTYNVNGLGLDPDGDIWLAAQTNDPNFPLVDPIQATFPPSNGFPEPVSVLNQFDPTGQTMKFSTFLGGNAPGNASSVAVDANHKAHVAGAAGYGMYTTPGVYLGSFPAPGAGYSGSTYAYVALIDPTRSGATLCLGGSAGAGLSFGYLIPLTTASQSVQVTNCGSGLLDFNSIASNNAAFTVPAGSNSCTGSIAAGSSCTVSVEFAPTAAQTYTGQLTFTSNATISTTSIPLSGIGANPAAAFPSSVVFQPLLVGQTSPPAVAELSNNGYVPVTIYPSQTAVTGDFALAPGGNCSNTLPAGSACSIAITFTPTATGTRTGTLSVSSNDPANPTITTTLTGTAFASYPVPSITVLLNPSYPINSGTTPITLSVYGSNFFPASVVYINGVAQATTYQSGTSLSVTFSPTLLNAVGQIPVTVVNPTPGGGTSVPYPLTAYLSIPLTASALTIDPVGGLLYAAIPASAAQNPNTVIPINPATGATMTPIAVASGPRALAVAGDGSELYVASSGVLQRFSLKTLALEKTFNLPVDPEWGQTYVQEMQVVPGSPQSIVVELFANVDPAEDGAALYNDSGLVNWISGVGATKNPLGMDSFTFTSPTAIYGLPEGNTFFAELQVGSTGLSVISSGGFSCCDETTGSLLASDGTLLYTNSGEVWNPTSQKLLGTYMEASGNQLFYTASVVPDTANGHTYFLDGDSGYSDFQSLDIDVFDQASYALVGTVPFMSIYSPNATDLVRWGSNGFAFRSFDITGTVPSANQIVIVTSNLVPASNGAPIPILLSVLPSSVVAGGPAFTLQLTGVGFTSASTVLINGNARTTTYVSSTSLTAQVPASDIATNGQLNVQVTTPAPGGGMSNYVTVPIEAPPLTTPTVTVTPSATSITAAQALTVTVAVSGGSGKATPTGSVTLSGGGYTSNATSLSNGSAIITIPAGSLTTGSDTISALYTPDSASSTTYNIAGGATLVTVTAPLKTTPTVTATPSASSITTAQSLSVSVTVSGGSGNPTPTGSVNIAGGGYTSAAISLTGGAAVITIPAGSLAVGTDALNVAYAPDSGSAATYNSATGITSVTVTAPAKSASTVTVTPASSTITNEQTDAVSIAVGGVSGQSTPTGTVTLTSGAYSAQQTLTGGAASITIPAGALSSGADTLTATYSGDGTYAGSSGAAIVTVAQVVISAPAPAAVSPGGSTTSNVTLSAGSNYSGTMNMSCALASSPTGAQSLPTCNMSPASVIIATGGNGATVLTVQTTAASSIALLAPTRLKLLGLGGGGTILAGLLLLGAPARRRRWMAMLVLLWIVVAAGAIGCGGGGGSNSGSGGSSIPATTAGTYSFKVTGIDSSNQAITLATNVSVTVE